MNWPDAIVTTVAVVCGTLCFGPVFLIAGIWALTALADLRSSKGEDK